MEPKQIPNRDLLIDKIPSAISPWSAIQGFALTFNGYGAFNTTERPEGCAELANSRQATSLTELRASLFFEQRRWRHFGESPGGLDLIYIQSLLWRIRQCVRRGLLD
jgi:hypothetical protein